jgi:hypothetical protein
MADKTISGLTAVTSLDGTEPLPLVQSGSTKKATVSQLLTGQIVNETTTSRTLATTDNGKVIVCSNASATTITVPAGLPIGFNCTFIQANTGKVTLSASSTIVNSYSALLSTMGQYAVISIISPDTDVFVAAGNLGV